MFYCINLLLLKKKKSFQPKIFSSLLFFFSQAFTANCYFGLGHIFKVPVVAISSAVEYPWVSDFVGNNENLAVVPNAFHIGIGKMSYWERVKNVIINYIELNKFHKLTDEYQTKAMRKYLSPDVPSIREVEKNVALTLVNNHPIIFGVKPIIPTLIQIAGLHIEENDETLSNVIIIFFLIYLLIRFNNNFIYKRVLHSLV